jgi:alpha-glucosidase (family GH31 glycosyl hydrolase)
VTAPKVTSWRVYLPENKGGWIYLRDETHYEGGRYAEVPVDLENIPVFKRVTE